MTPYQVTDHTQGPAILALLHLAFADMHARIDPPSSLHRLTVDTLFASGEVWSIIPATAAEPLACMVLTPRAPALYIGKLAVAPQLRGHGLGRVLMDAAARRARALGLLLLELQTRVELTENHATFRALGFVETARGSHAGFARPTTITFQRTV